MPSTAEPDPSLSGAGRDDIPRMLQAAATDAAGQDFPAATLYVIATPIGKQEVELRLTQHDGAVSGTATQGTETVPLLDPQLDGERLRWAQNVTRPMKLAIRFDVTRDGDTLSGTAKPGILPSVRVVGQRGSVPA